MKWNKRCAGAALACGLLAGSTVAATPAAARTLDCTMWVSKDSYIGNCDTDARALVTLRWTCKTWWGGRGTSGSRSIRVSPPGMSIGVTTNCRHGYHSYSMSHRWL